MSDGPDVRIGRALAQRLIDRAHAGSGAQNSTDAAGAAVERLYVDLSRWVGLDGSHALLTRALAAAREEHPPLAAITLHSRSTPYLQGITEAVEKHGPEKTAAALEAMVAILIELLGRLIGSDMTANLIERGLGGFPESEANREGGGNHE
ncbi:MAG TPA: hypothetical protein VM099_01445 [Gemmatimonadaceae bacterium]|nr:hypothetical protein [Gemmatimonadaceae bacterium]